MARKRAAVQVGAIVGATLGSQLALALSGPLVVRLLGVEGRGRLAELFAVVLLVSQIGMAGYPQAWSYHLAMTGVSPAEMVRAHARSYLVHGVVATLVATTAAYVLGSLGHFDQLWLAASSAGLAVVGIFVARMSAALLEGTSEFIRLAIVIPIPALSYAAVVVFLTVRHTGSVAVLLLLNAAAWMIAALITMFFARQQFRRESEAPPPSPSALRRYAWRVLVAVSSPIDNLGIDQLLVVLLLNHTDLGYYAIGLAFESGPVLVLGSLARMVAPKVAGAAPEIKMQVARRWILVATGLGLATVGSIELIVPPVLRFAFGAEAIPALGITRALVFAGLLLGLRMVTYGCLQGVGRPGTATVCELFGVATMVLVMVIGTGPLGVTAAPLALGIGGLVALVASLIGLRRRTVVPRGRPRALAVAGSPE
ncbi:MAG TPA: hypothetical protein VN108_10980 [Marmoricola sp.]|nr:hypothetical protein [Marmoricola sp.]